MRRILLQKDEDEILKLVQKVLEDNKAQDVTVIDLKGKTSIANQMVVASGTSNRHVAAMADKLLEALKKAGFKATAEGMEKADWVLIDAFDVIVHIFRPEVRAFYNLEKMWQAVSDKRK
ncbi:MAG: ribosome silencing factor [Alphaproteobacteria bacterium]|nr:ribosome silencing factor [Alphaproteobacteria bacterium]